MPETRGGSATNFVDYSCLILTPALLSAGQFFFKRASGSLVVDSLVRFIGSLLVNPYFWIALFIYGAATVLWVFTLSRVPLSRAMPFVALTFAIVPVVSVVALGEKLNLAYWIGVAIIAAGVYVTVAALRST